VQFSIVAINTRYINDQKQLLCRWNLS